MTASTEYINVEKPFLDQLQGAQSIPRMQSIPALGWDVLPGDTAVPYLTERETFRQVLLTGRLRAALQRINLDDDGQPWLDRARITQAVSRLERLGQPKLMAANQVATRLLIKGVQVPGPDPASDNWDAQVEALRDLIRNYRETQAETEREDRAVRPFLRLLVDANAKANAADGPSAPIDRQALAAAAVALVDRIRREIGRVDFWRKRVAQEQLRADILRYLDDHDLAPFDQQSALADQLLDTARANHTLLTEG